MKSKISNWVDGVKCSTCNESITPENEGGWIEILSCKKCGEVKGMRIKSAEENDTSDYVRIDKEVIGDDK